MEFSECSMADKTVFTNGCFDVLHRGHLELLKYCREIGDKVIVGINNDQGVKRLKGHLRPLNSQEDRKFALESLRYIDEVLIFSEDTPYNLIKSVSPDIIVKGGDYIPENVVGSDLAEVRIFKYVDGYSTTEILQNFSDRRKL
ncbi:MAG TPA: D-glycero-beta-D-manno-heptose 1-phosphate adenylyltransferase [Nitrospinaceae bacterium]|nr:D-glycero-beta-D-manno-heptose 1-phosphate adenylyltransferase [Nitrospinaceae bacterium]